MSRIGDMASSLSKPTDARSSAMASPDGKAPPTENQKGDGLGEITTRMS